MSGLPEPAEVELELLASDELYETIGTLVVSGYSNEDIIGFFTGMVHDEQEALLQTAMEAAGTPL